MIATKFRDLLMKMIYKLLVEELGKELEGNVRIYKQEAKSIQEREKLDYVYKMKHFKEWKSSKCE